MLLKWTGRDAISLQALFLNDARKYNPRIPQSPAGPLRYFKFMRSCVALILYPLTTPECLCPLALQFLVRSHGWQYAIIS